MRIANAAAVLTTVAAIAIPATASADPPHRPLGGLDLWSYCRSAGYDGVTLLGGQIAPDAVFNWRCFRGATLDEFSMLDACRWQYGRDDVHADYLNRNDAYTWVCFEGSEDDEPPTIEAPDLVVDATSAAGANVVFLVTATDAVDPAPTVACSPSSGSLFPIGASSVSCTATDDAGNSAQATFAVLVLGAADQLDNLQETILAYNLAPDGFANSLLVKLRAALDALAAEDTDTGCTALQDFLNQVAAQRGKKLTAAQADELTDDATRVRTVVGC